MENYWSQFVQPATPKYKYRPTVYKLTTPMTTRPMTTTTTTTTQAPLSPHYILSSVVKNQAGVCGVRSTSYMPHFKRRKGRRGRKRQLPRRGRVVWDDDESMGSAPAPSSTFPWMAGLFMLIPSSATGEALFMCAGAVLTPNIIVTAAHCFTGNANNPDLWFARVGDNYILKPDANEQTFRVKKIIKHSLFDPLRDDGGDGRNDIAILVLQGHKGRNPKRQSRNKGLNKNSSTKNGLIAFSKDVRPICIPPQQDYPINKLKTRHCEIAGWGMTEYNNSASYPDSIRAAQITVGNIPSRYCDYLYKRNVKDTGKFCAGGKVDACQEDSGGPLVCKLDDGKYHFIGIVSSGKGCGVYPGLYTEVSRYIDWLAYWVSKESVA